MKTIKAMDVEQFIDLLLTMHNGDTYNFALTQIYEPDDREPDTMDFENWYFAKLICIQEYGSRFILLDYAGGEEAMAIPLNGYKNEQDDDDRMIVPGYVYKFFNEHMINKVYVEQSEI